MVSTLTQAPHSCTRFRPLAACATGGPRFQPRHSCMTHIQVSHAGFNIRIEEKRDRQLLSLCVTSAHQPLLTFSLPITALKICVSQASRIKYGHQSLSQGWRSSVSVRGRLTHNLHAPAWATCPPSHRHPPCLSVHAVDVHPRMHLYSSTTNTLPAPPPTRTQSLSTPVHQRVHSSWRTWDACTCACHMGSDGSAKQCCCRWWLHCCSARDVPTAVQAAAGESLAVQP